MKWRLAALTFNVNNQPCSAILQSLLTEVCSKSGSYELDGFVVSLQEVNPSERASICPDGWKEKLTELMFSRGLYCVSSSFMMTNFIAFFLKRRYMSAVKQCTYEYVKDLYYGAKGSIGLLVQMNSGVALLLVGSHFVHGSDQNDQRVLQAKRVKDFASRTRSSVPVASSIWLGDFNFRVVDLDGPSLITRLNQEPDLCSSSEFMQRHDQLSAARFYYDVFDEWEEAVIKFKPTYKYRLGSETLNLERTPSWTDRILLDRASCLVYTSIQEVRISDHKPVCAIIETNDIPFNVMSTWEVEFEDIRSWPARIPLSVHFKAKSFWEKDGSVWDWIGVYKVPQLSDRRYVASVTVVSCGESNDKYTAQFPTLTPGAYVVAYHSYKNSCIKGLSDVFCIEQL